MDIVDIVLGGTSWPDLQRLFAVPEVRLRIERGRARHLVRRVAVPLFLIGSGPDCDLVLGDPQLPQVHSYLLVGRAGVRLHWLGRLPQVTVEGRPVQAGPLAAPLEDSDRLSLGPYRFSFHIAALPAAAHKEPIVDWPQPAALGRRSDAAPELRQVQVLLQDIRRQMASPPDPLCLYAQSHSFGQRSTGAPPSASPRRASA